MSCELEMYDYQNSDRENVITLFENGNASYRSNAPRSDFDDYMRRARSGEMDRLSNSLADHGGQFWVIKNGVTTVGMFGLEPQSLSRMLLRRLYVSPEMQGRGLARWIILKAEEKAREFDAKELSLMTSSHQSRAIRLYKRMGYSMHPDPKPKHPLRCLNANTSTLRGLKPLLA